MSTNRVSPDAGWVHDVKRLPCGPNGRALCRQCRQEVPKGRRTFCGDACVHAWKIRTSPPYARTCVEKRDHGICASCGLDTKRLLGWLRMLAHLAHRVTVWGWSKSGRWNSARRRRFVAVYRAAAEFLLDCGFGTKWARAQVRGNRIMDVTSIIGHAWEADHIVPVVEGGGEVGLEGYRTLCIPCHKRETRALRRRQVERRNGQQVRRALVE